MQATTQTDETVSIDEKRARFEQFSFRVPKPGFVNVANHSYGDEEAGEHCYTVRLSAEDVTGCSCPHHEHRGARCKHMRAVANQEAVMMAGTVDEAPESSSSVSDSEADECPHGSPICPGLEAGTSYERTLQCYDCKSA